MAKEVFEETKLDSDGAMVSLDIKTFYKNVPLNQDINIAMWRLYGLFSGKSMLKLLNFDASGV